MPRFDAAAARLSNVSGAIVVSMTAAAVQNSALPRRPADGLRPMPLAVAHSCTSGSASISPIAAASVASRSPRFDPSPSKQVGIRRAELKLRFDCRNARPTNSHAKAQSVAKDGNCGRITSRLSPVESSASRSYLEDAQQKRQDERRTLVLPGRTGLDLRDNTWEGHPGDATGVADVGPSVAPPKIVAEMHSPISMLAITPVPQRTVCAADDCWAEWPSYLFDELAPHSAHRETVHPTSHCLRCRFSAASFVLSFGCGLSRHDDRSSPTDTTSR